MHIYAYNYNRTKRRALNLQIAFTLLPATGILPGDTVDTPAMVIPETMRRAPVLVCRRASEIGIERLSGFWFRCDSGLPRLDVTHVDRPRLWECLPGIYGPCWGLLGLLRCYFSLIEDVSHPLLVESRNPGNLRNVGTLSGKLQHKVRYPLGIVPVLFPDPERGCILRDPHRVATVGQERLPTLDEEFGVPMPEVGSKLALDDFGFLQDDGYLPELAHLESSSEVCLGVLGDAHRPEGVQGSVLVRRHVFYLSSKRGSASRDTIPKSCLLDD